jgi:hypothetical protein
MKFNRVHTLLTGVLVGVVFCAALTLLVRIDTPVTSAAASTNPWDQVATGSKVECWYDSEQNYLQCNVQAPPNYHYTFSMKAGTDDTNQGVRRWWVAPDKDFVILLKAKYLTDEYNPGYVVATGKGWPLPLTPTPSSTNTPAPTATPTPKPTNTPVPPTATLNPCAPVKQ